MEELRKELSDLRALLQDKKDKYRFEFGTLCLQEIKKDEKCPTLLKTFIAKAKSTHVKIVRYTLSADYMPDSCIYFDFPSSDKEGLGVSIPTTQKSECWSEFGSTPTCLVAFDDAVDEMDYVDEFLGEGHGYSAVSLEEVRRYCDKLFDSLLATEQDLFMNIIEEYSV